MLETFIGYKSLNSASPAMSDDPTPHVLKMRQHALQVCNFVMGHLPDNPLRMEEVHRAQNTFRLRALLLRSLQEVGEWESLVDGIEVGINTASTSSYSPSAGPVNPIKMTLDDLLLQAHSIGTLICDQTSSDAPPPDDSVGGASPIPPVEREAPEWSVLQPTLLLSPEEALGLLPTLWPAAHGSLPSIAVLTAPGNLQDDVWIERLKFSTNTATSRLLRTWATRVQDLLESQPSTTWDHAVSARVPGSLFRAGESLVVLAVYLALSLSPTAMSYNDTGILLSSLDGQPRASRLPRSSSPEGTTGHSLSREYFEAGLAVDPHNPYLLTNLGSYWRKERNCEEAIRCVSPPPQVSWLTSEPPSIVVISIVIPDITNWR